MEKEDINALDEMHKGSCMGCDAIHFILDKVSNKKFRSVLKNQYKEYENIMKEIEDVYPKYNDDNPHETSKMEKMMTWYGIEMKTLSDDSDSKISELLLKGTNMGIIEGRKILNNKNLNEETSNIAHKYVTMQEKYIEILKEYL